MNKITPNETKDKIYKLPCQSCAGKTNHKVLTSIQVDGDHEFDRNFSINFWEDYEIVQCQGCENISFRKNHKNTEDIDYHTDPTGEHHQELADHIELFPKRVLGKQQLNQASLIPYEIYRIYNETHKALSNNLSILTTIGIRALIEAVCQEKSASGSNLKQKIDSLEDLGLLTDKSVKILHSIRLLGNSAAHEVDPPSENIIHTAFEIVEHMLSNVYIIPEISKRLNDE